MLEESNEAALREGVAALQDVEVEERAKLGASGSALRRTAPGGSNAGRASSEAGGEER
jgi:hypothetical protein